MVRTAPWMRLTLRLLVVGYLVLLVGWPVSTVVTHTFDDGFAAIDHALSDPNVTHALWLTARVTAISVLINTVFGVIVSILLVRYEFRGKRILSALLDVPLSVSPVVVGLSLLLVYSPRYGWFGEGLHEAGIQIIYATPGIVMATTFVALPLVIREVVPVLEEIGDEQEWAARSLGASSYQTLRRITLPAIKWAIVYGVVLALARALGEYGAVKVVSGGIVGSSQTATQLVDERYQNFDQPAAYAVAFLLAFASVVCIGIVAILRPKQGTTR